MKTLLKCMKLLLFVLLMMRQNKASLAAPSDSDSSTLIVGGREAQKGEFPFIVGLRKSSSHHCGGSIISPDWIVTAAHCSNGDEASFTIVAGDHVNDEDEGTEQARSVSRKVVHPDYNLLTNENDIALFQVYPPFNFDEFVGPIDLAPPGFIPSSLTHVVAGWGRLSEGGPSSRTLMKVGVPFVSPQGCREAYGARFKEDSMMCAGGNGRDSCQGDSGGPLICSDRGEERKTALCGLVSWGTGCARPDKPGVYTKISYFQPWINSVVQGV